MVGSGALFRLYPSKPSTARTRAWLGLGLGLGLAG